MTNEELAKKIDMLEFRLELNQCRTADDLYRVAYPRLLKICQDDLRKWEEERNVTKISKSVGPSGEHGDSDGKV